MVSLRDADSVGRGRDEGGVREDQHPGAGGVHDSRAKQRNMAGVQWKDTDMDKGGGEEIQELLNTCGGALSRRFGSADRAFSFFDEDADGIISIHELVSGLKRLGVSLSAREVRTLVRVVDDQDDLVSRQRFEEFFGLQGMSVQTAQAVGNVHDALYVSRLIVRDVFTAADGSREGRVLPSALSCALTALLQDSTGEHADTPQQFARLCALHDASAQKRRNIANETGAASERGLTYTQVVHTLQLPARPIDWEVHINARTDTYTYKHAHAHTCTRTHKHMHSFTHIHTNM